jgi:hypothetical protein
MHEAVEVLLAYVERNHPKRSLRRFRFSIGMQITRRSDAVL